jgi:hypothetical protein
MTFYQERNDFYGMLKALNILMREHDDQKRIKFVFEVLLSSVHRSPEMHYSTYKVTYPQPEEISELLKMTQYKKFRTYKSCKRSWTSKPKSVRLVCDVLYNTLLY